MFISLSTIKNYKSICFWTTKIRLNINFISKCCFRHSTIPACSKNDKVFMEWEGYIFPPDAVYFDAVILILILSLFSFVQFLSAIYCHSWHYYTYESCHVVTIICD